VPCRINRRGREPFRGGCVDPAKETAMAGRKQDQDLPHRDGEEAEEIEREAEKSRKALDEVPPPGTDPLHEGP
jgi:hypothetical protein